LRLLRRQPGWWNWKDVEDMARAADLTG